MERLFSDISMSLDGFIAGPFAGPEHPLGIGGDRLHQWVYQLESWRRQHGLSGGVPGPESDAMRESFERTGAYLMGHGMYRVSSQSWGTHPPFSKPVFVLSHTPREPDVRTGGTTFMFVTDGLRGALARAKDAAGLRDVCLAGGADIIQQAIGAGVLDELRLHIVPVLLGSGTRLFDRIGAEYIEWETSRVNGASGTVHLTLRPTAPARSA
ncbi:dihydrofolate reductase family protein [Streptomyces sp. TS71-3]|uniref:dihydrofolate reductase family protein n=1 Tax=Streptomyces sp. TS71-3 TaxID=2733862 RepID=UPI001B0F7C87|nr:dihydrofolate reductase family protein [Streptomyces sp. TS71-3]GHJ37937.1 deaminase [Streptomyces sp. TS71-3]